MHAHGHYTLSQCFSQNNTNINSAWSFCRSLVPLSIFRRGKEVKVEPLWITGERKEYAMYARVALCATQRPCWVSPLHITGGVHNPQRPFVVDLLVKRQRWRSPGSIWPRLRERTAALGSGLAHSITFHLLFVPSFGYLPLISWQIIGIQPSQMLSTTCLLPVPTVFHFFLFPSPPLLPFLPPFLTHCLKSTTSSSLLGLQGSRVRVK